MSDQNNDCLSDWLDDDMLPSTGTTDELLGQSSDSIAESILVHGLLSDIGRRDKARDDERIQALMQLINADTLAVEGATEFDEPLAGAKHLLSPTAGKRRTWISILSSALAVAAVVMVMFIVTGPQHNVSAAMTSLEKILSTAAEPFDRTYRVRVVEEYPRDKQPRNLPSDVRDRKVKEQLDGATLYVRGVNQYVLEVMLWNGLKRTSGCDGIVSWAFREDGPVHESMDLNRFRGGIPGQQQDIPFINIHSHLSQLHSDYEVELTLKQETTSSGTIVSQLVGKRKSDGIRGPKVIDLWFDEENGTVHKILLDGLPRGRGGPKSLMLELIGQSELTPQFFSHDSHHEPGRQVRHEDKQ